MAKHYEPPEFDKDAFTCPHCGAYAAMLWQLLRSPQRWEPVKVARCHRCSHYSVWLDGTDNYPLRMIYPSLLTAPVPSEDLPDDCNADYLEAREIAANSPRGAAALLRLCIQKLAVHLGGEGKNINNDIGKLVQNGLPQRIQQALDVVRVVGNNAVHPGEMSVHDKPETVQAMFELVNLIVENQITQPKQVTELFSSLPDSAKNAIGKRDGKA